MPEVTVADASGETLSMMDFDGFKVSLFGRTPDYITNVYKNLPNFKFRQDDIFVASYPKAGTYVILPHPPAPPPPPPQLHTHIRRGHYFGADSDFQIRDGLQRQNIRSVYVIITFLGVVGWCDGAG